MSSNQMLERADALDLSGKNRDHGHDRTAVARKSLDFLGISEF